MQSRFRPLWRSASNRQRIDRTACQRGVILLLMLLMAGCASQSGRYSSRTDSYPGDGRDLSHIPDARPHYEPRSKGGNNPAYTVLGQRYTVLPSAQNYVEEGTASFYGNKFHGYATSNGEPYDMYAMTAAHKRLPLPSYARVTNLDNGRTVVVRINDRGPFHDERIIDLSYAAAWRLGISGRGTGRVRIEGIDPLKLVEGAPSPPLPLAAPVKSAPDSSSVGAQVGSAVMKAGKALQVAALSSAPNARQLQTQLSAQLSMPVSIQQSDTLYRVHVGPFQDDVALIAARRALQDAGYAHPIEVTVMP